MIKKLRQGQNPIQWCLSCTGMWERRACYVLHCERVSNSMPLERKQMSTWENTRVHPCFLARALFTITADNYKLKKEKKRLNHVTGKWRSTSTCCC